MSANHGITYELLPAMDAADYVLRKSYQAYFHEDNTAMIRAIITGRNPTMRHLGRVHRVSVQWMHESLGKHPNAGSTVLFYDDTQNMSADVYTKAFQAPDKWDHAIHLINVFHKSELTPEFLSAWVSERAHYDRGDESKRTKEPIVSKAGHRREVQRDRASL